MPKQALGKADAKAAGNEITLGFVLPYNGDSRDFEQRMPNGMGPFTMITEQIPGLTIEGPGIGPRTADELNGRKFWVMRGDAVAAGGTLSFTARGLPAIDRSGRTVSGVLALLLIVGGFVFGRRPATKMRKVIDEREKLTARREALFAELVALERDRRQAAAGAGGAPTATDKRNQLVGKLESLYQDLAALDEQRAL
jgi:hypothetical protein